LEGERVYPQPRNIVFNAILDIMELQNGKQTFSDSPRGKVHFQISMYGCKWEVKFSAADTEGGGCAVKLEIGGEAAERKRMLQREFSLLDSALAAESNVLANGKGY